MPNIPSIIKNVRNIMRQDRGVSGDAQRLEHWVEALSALGVRLHFPVHPRTAAVCERVWGGGWREVLAAKGFELSGPLGYRGLIERVRSVQAVITDSGGLQKEAYGFQKPCIVARPVTEWVELVAAGAVHLCGEPDGLEAAWKWAQHAVTSEVGLYGHGAAARQIAEAMSQAPWS